MSYILEALRKSEQERNADKVPDLTTSHTHIHKQKKKNYFWWIIATVLIVTNGLILFYTMNEDAATENVSETVLETEPTLAEDEPATKIVSAKQQVENSSIAIQSEADGNAVTNEVSDPEHSSAEQVVQVVTAKPIEQIAKTIDSEMLPDITALSYNIQQQLPEMEYSTHVHVKEGGSFIIINGRSFGEGQQIVQGLKIMQIQSDGIILEYKGRRFFMASMTDWIKN